MHIRISNGRSLIRVNRKGLLCFLIWFSVFLSLFLFSVFKCELFSVFKCELFSVSKRELLSVFKCGFLKCE